MALEVVDPQNFGAFEQVALRGERTSTEPDGLQSATLAFRAGTYTIDGTWTVPRTVSLWFAKGAVLNVRGALFIQGTIMAAPFRIFELQGATASAVTSNVVLATYADARSDHQQSIAELAPEWWGAGEVGDGGLGLVAMARSLETFAGRYTIHFGLSGPAKVYRSAGAVFDGGHRFAGQNGAVIEAAQASQPSVLTVMPSKQVVQRGAQTVSFRTTFEGLEFRGLGGNQNSNLREQTLLSIPHSMPVSVADCAFNTVNGVGLRCGLGVRLQASRVSAEQCSQAGLLVSQTSEQVGAPNIPPTTFVQWNNALDNANLDAGRLSFDADMVVQTGSDRAVVQLTHTDMQGRLIVESGVIEQAQETLRPRMTLTHCNFQGAVSLGVPSGIVTASHCQFNAAIQDEPTKSILVGEPAAVSFDECTFTFTEPAPEEPIPEDRIPGYLEESGIDFGGLRDIADQVRDDSPPLDARIPGFLESLEVDADIPIEDLPSSIVDDPLEGRRRALSGSLRDAARDGGVRVLVRDPGRRNRGRSSGAGSTSQGRAPSPRDVALELSWSTPQAGVALVSKSHFIGLGGSAALKVLGQNNAQPAVTVTRSRISDFDIGARVESAGSIYFLDKLSSQQQLELLSDDNGVQHLFDVNAPNTVHLAVAQSVAHGGGLRNNGLENATGCLSFRKIETLANRTGSLVFPYNRRLCVWGGRNVRVRDPQLAQQVMDGLFKEPQAFGVPGLQGDLLFVMDLEPPVLVCVESSARAATWVPITEI